MFLSLWLLVAGVALVLAWRLSFARRSIQDLRDEKTRLEEQVRTTAGDRLSLLNAFEDERARFRHDVAGHLNVIFGFGQVLTDSRHGVLAPNQRECVDYILRATRNLMEQLEHERESRDARTQELVRQ